jgi:hypothetical protein
VSRHVYENALGVSILALSTIIRLNSGNVIKKPKNRRSKWINSIPFILKIKALPWWSFLCDNPLEVNRIPWRTALLYTLENYIWYIQSSRHSSLHVFIRPDIKNGQLDWIHIRNIPKIFAPPSARRNFFKCALLTWIPGSAPDLGP